jgi:hypothetical protein
MRKSPRGLLVSTFPFSGRLCIGRGGKSTTSSVPTPHHHRTEEEALNHDDARDGCASTYIYI